MKTPIYLGRAIINYDENGYMTKSEFTPYSKIIIEEEFASKIGEKIQNVTDLRTIQHNSEMVLATWFSQMTDIELADPEKFSIVSSNVECLKHENNMIKQCIIDYHFIERTINQA